MFIRVTQINVKDGCWSDLVSSFNTSTIPHLESHDGFMRVILTGDETLGQGNLISMWKNAELGGGTGKSGTDYAIQTLSEFIDGQPTTTGYPEIAEREF